MLQFLRWIVRWTCSKGYGPEIFSPQGESPVEQTGRWRPAFDPGGLFGPRLPAIARRRIVDCLRRRIRVLDKEVSLTAHLEVLTAPDPDCHHVELDRAILRGAIRALPRAVGKRDRSRLIPNIGLERRI